MGDGGSRPLSPITHMGGSGMGRNGYSLDQFTHDMMALVRSQPDQQKLFECGADHLARLLRVPDALPEQFTLPSGRGRRQGAPGRNHGRYALHRSDGLFISAVVWGPGDHVDPHDHHTWGMI